MCITQIFRGGRLRSRGSAITEAGPALFILLMVFFFPLLNFIAMGLAYADCLYLHNLLLRQASLERVLVINPAPPPAYTTDLSCSTAAAGSLNTIITAWRTEGLGRFVETGVVPTQTAWINLAEGTNSGRFIHVELNIQVKPFLPIPFPFAVPGINAPVSLKFNGKRVIERMPV